jgi:selenide,water dikinase
VKRILLVGAGHAHLVVLRALTRTPLYGARVALVSPNPLQIYSGMLPGLIAGHYSLDEVQVDVAALAESAYVEFVQGAVAALDPQRRIARLEGGSEAEYDYVSLDAGSLVERSIPGAVAEALAVKPFEAFVRSLRSPSRVAVAGGGVAGAEVAMALRHAGAQVTLYAEKPFAPRALAKRLVRVLRRRGVDYRPGMPVTAIEPGPVVVAGTAHQEFDRVVLATGAVPLPWLARAGLATDERGFVLVHRTLQSVSHPEVFAAGDCATLRDAPHPKSGLYSVRHGEVLERNLRLLVRAQPLVEYEPQRRALSLLSCGARYAIAEWGGWTAQGRWVWWWKDRIDRGWIRSFSR